MILVYTHKITPRVTYIFKHVFERMLGGKVGFTTKVEEFIAHKGTKLSYTRQQLGNEFFIKNHELLFEQGITDFDIKVQQWDGLPAFFSTSDKSALPYDIFAASFFLLSRYEEYFPYVGDAFGRFPAKESIAHQNDFLEVPVVDLWVGRLKETILARFPDTEFQAKNYHFLPIIEVPSAFTYIKKGILRTLAGTLLDLFSFRLRRVVDRLAVLLGLRRDPANNFSRYTVLHQQYGVKAIFFFLVSDFSAYDHPISYNNNKFRSIVKSVSDYDQVALLNSFDSSERPEQLMTERKRLEELVHKDIKQTRCHMGNLSIPEKYRQLVDAEFSEDYSMSYANVHGFRAGTSSPFLFYDIGGEMQLPIKVFSPCTSSYLLHKLGHVTKIQERLTGFYNTIGAVNGHFIITLRNTTIAEVNDAIRWRELYIETLKNYVRFEK